MSPDQFNEFLAKYRDLYGPINDGNMAEKLGIHRDTMTNLKQRGAGQYNLIWLYALSAIMHNLEPYKRKADEISTCDNPLCPSRVHDDT